MIYTKLALTFEQQADLLIQRGLATDRDEFITVLCSVNYYRLSGYLYPFRKSDHTFYPGTNFNQVWRRYTFDRHLRLLTLDAIERVEDALRTQLVYEHVHAYGPFGYTNLNNLPKLNNQDFESLQHRIRMETKRSQEVFVKHFINKYRDNHEHLPLWMVVEIIPFGLTFTLYNAVETRIMKTLASIYGVPDVVLKSWLGTINAIRNICAHHGRLWNRQLSFRHKIPKYRKKPTMAYTSRHS